MATHSSVLAWQIPWAEEPSQLESVGSQKVRYDLATKQQRGERKNAMLQPLRHRFKSWLSPWPSSTLGGVSPGAPLSMISIPCG